MTENDLAVVELSSFQLMGMKHFSAQAITTLTPNHLDYHSGFLTSMCRPRLPFTAIRARTTSFILNLDDEVTRSLKASGNLFCTSKRRSWPTACSSSDDVI